jgi:hypothetical protein
MSPQAEKKKREPWEDRFDTSKPVDWQGYTNRRRRRWKKKHRIPGEDPDEISEEDESARAIINGALAMFGLESLAEWAWQLYLDGAPIEQIMLELRQRPEYAQRFPAMAELANRGRAISEFEYINYEREAARIMHGAGLAAGFYDQPDDFAALLIADLSLNELAQRIQGAYVRVAHASDEIRDIFGEYFGASGDNALAMVFLDPDRALPILEQEVSAAEFGGTGRRFGFEIGRMIAERAASLGVDLETATGGFQRLDVLRPLFDETISELQDYVAERECVNALFGLEAGDQLRVERRRAEREAAFAGASGGALLSGEGVTGLGPAPQQRR